MTTQIGTDPRDAEIARLRELVAQRTAERDVWSGEACRAEQAAGNGPCGACRYCYPAQLAAAQAETERWRTREASGQAEIERLGGEREANRVRIRAAQADAVALREALEQVHGLNVAWQGDLSQHCADPLTVLDNMLAITEPIVSTAKSPGAPLLDAVRGLATVNELVRADVDTVIAREVHLQADNAALRGVVQEVHGLIRLLHSDMAAHCGDPSIALDNMLALTEPFVSTEAPPGAPLLDAVRGLVAAGEDLLRNAQQVLDDIGPVRRRQSIDGANMSQEFSDMYTDAREAMRIALAAVRAVVPTAKESTNAART